MARVIVIVIMMLKYLPAAVCAQTPIQVLRFDQSTGIIDHGEDVGINIGDVFEVNRYKGEFVYWVGRVEVFVVRPKIAGIKLLTKSEQFTVQKGDMLALQRAEFDPMVEKLDGSRVPRKIVAREQTAKPLNTVAPPSSPILLNTSAGAVYSLPGASRAMGLSLALQITNSSNRVIAEIDMARAYTNGLALHTGFTLPLTPRISLDLNYAYLRLHIRNATESQLLRFGLKASASLAHITACANYRFANHWQAGVGTGLYLPQVRVQGGRQDVTRTERQWGWMLSLAHLLTLGEKVWLKTTFAYNVFLDNGPAIHYFALQLGPSFAIRR